MMARGESFTAAVDMMVEQCCNCGIAFAMTAEFKKDRLERRKGDCTFYCPRGHAQHYTGESEATLLRRERDRLKQQEAYLVELRRVALASPSPRRLMLGPGLSLLAPADQAGEGRGLPMLPAELRESAPAHGAPTPEVRRGVRGRAGRGVNHKPMRPAELRAAMIELGCASNQGLADLIGVQRSSVGNWLGGQTVRKPIAMLIRLLVADSLETSRASSVAAVGQ